MSYVIPFIAAVLTTTLFAYALAASYQLAVLANEGIRFRSFPNASTLAPLCQNFGLTFALFGFLQLDLSFITVGVLLIALRSVTLPLRAPAEDDRFEPILLGMAMVSIGLLGAIHFLPRLTN